MLYTVVASAATATESVQVGDRLACGVEVLEAVAIPCKEEEVDTWTYVFGKPGELRLRVGQVVFFFCVCCVSAILAGVISA